MKPAKVTFCVCVCPQKHVVIAFPSFNYHV
jgi:hypothetical protein